MCAELLFHQLLAKAGGLGMEQLDQGKLMQADLLVDGKQGLDGFGTKEDELLDGRLGGSQKFALADCCDVVAIGRGNE